MTDTTTLPFSPREYRTDAPMIHRPGCTEPGCYLVAGYKDGRAMQRCSGCKAARPAARVRPAEPDPRSRYRCREHLDRPVTRHGTGCPDCERDRRRKKRDRTTRAPAKPGDLALTTQSPPRHPAAGHREEPTMTDNKTSTQRLGRVA